MCIVITGGTRGLGFEITKLLAASGYQVAVVARRRSEVFDAWAKQTHNPPSFHPFDFSTDGDYTVLYNQIVKMHGTIDTLINNAAVGNDGILATQHMTDISACITTNLIAPIKFTKICLRSMIKEKKGLVINISSIIASTGFSGLSVYAASKAGLLGFTKSLAREVGKLNIKVVSVSPGYMDTEMTHGIDNENYKKILRRSPLGRLITTTEVAKFVNTVITDPDKFHGQDIILDCGSTV